MKALVDATDNSLPQLRNTPQLSSLDNVDITLLTTLILVSPHSFASLKGINKSIVSPDYDTERKPPPPPKCFILVRSH